MTTDVEGLRRKRGRARTKLEGLVKQLSNLLDQQPLPSQQECDVYLSSIREMKRKVEDHHEDLEEVTADAEIHIELKYWNEVNDLVLYIERKVVRKVSVPTHASATTSSQPDQNTTPNPTNPAQQRSQVKLPDLSLPKFEGDVHAWPAFWDQYRVAVDENKNMDAAQKFVYLRSCLKGTALSAIEGFPVTRDQYPNALEILKNRFGKPRIIVESYITAILDAESKSYADATNLTDLRNSLETKIRSLAAIGRDADKNEIPVSEILIPIFKRKLPMYTRKRWETRIVQEGTDPTLKKFFAFLTEEVEIEQAVNATKSIQKSTKFSQLQVHVRKSQDERLPTASALATVTTKDKCPYCEKDAHLNVQECAKLAGISPAERYSLVKKYQACTRCLPKGHFRWDCRSKASCVNCGKPHHTMLHEENFKPHDVTSHFVNEGQGRKNSSRVPLLQTAKALLVTPEGKSFPVRCLFDTGSQRSFIERGLADDLGLKGPREKIRLSTLSEDAPKVTNTVSVGFTLKSATAPTDENNAVVNALTVKKISPIEVPVIDPREFPHLLGIEWADDAIQGSQSGHTKLQVDVIIGSEVYWEFFTSEVRKGHPSAMQSLFGWVLGGTCSGSYSSTHVHCYKTSILGPEEECLWKQFQDLETLGIKESNTGKRSEEGNHVYETFKTSAEFKEGRYHVGIPWHNDSQLPDNYWVAKKRFLRQERKLQDEPAKAKQYAKAMKEYEELGFSEEVPQQEIKPKHVWYLPHSAVFREERETTKCRVVFDGSATCSGISLNSVIHTGPALQPNIVGVILRFRRWKVAFLADIQKMFMQIAVKSDDRDAMRYIWRENRSQPLKIYHFLRVCFGMNVSPFLAIGTVKMHAERSKDKYPEVAKEVDDNMYVDDLPSGRNDVASAMKFVKDSVDMMSEGGFPLVKFISNEQECLKLLPEGHIASVMSKPSEDRHSQVLGIKWNLHDDVLGIAFSLVKVKENEVYTKRHVLRGMASIFDPMGFVSPFLMQAKIIFRETWRSKIAWDESLTCNLTTKWRTWVDEVSKLNLVKVKRWVDVFTAEKIELHAFGDASGSGYGSVVYMRYWKDKEVYVQLLVSKNRIAPMKEITLPKLELMAALVTARLVTFVIHEMLQGLPVDVFCWSDSQVTVQWIKQPRNDQVFVRNRVDEIKRLVPVENWRHLPGKVNPADRISRGQSLTSLLKDDDWWTGPVWLKTWTTCLLFQPDKDPKSAIKTLENEQQSAATTGINEVPALATLVQPVESGYAYVRKLAWIQRFLSNSRNPQAKTKGNLKVAELKRATLSWIKITQNKFFSSELQSFEQGTGLPKSSTVKALDPFLDSDGLIRVGGRLQNAKLPYEQRHQVLLPYESKVAAWMIERSHLDNLHSGTEQVLSQVRQGYWIPKARRLVKATIQRCPICQKERTKRMQQKMGILPQERVTVTRPFTNVGVDFAGPLYVKNDDKSLSKNYICLFTCMASRAIHLELVTCLSTEVFMMALRRMIARRGKCEIIWSDNAETFKSANEEMKRAASKALKSADNQLTQEGIQWKFIPERAPWWGGVYERLVRSVKTALRKVLQNAEVDYEEMTTVLTEVECQINSRPLTKVSSDPADSEPLTPAHLLIGAPLKPSDVHQVNASASDNTSLQGRWRYRQRLASHFWNRWTSEYLTELQQRAKWFQPQRNVRQGDLVLIEDDRMKRGKWTTGVVKEVTIGKDGLVRSALVKTNKGDLTRPIQRLHLLEAAPPGEDVGN